ncbi:cupin [Streptacidiphilus pinicola]|uniref:Cupin n=1 Tax=Streptacidiphilus pinicola TaxID=2219663 RepID=A0A2X0IGX9_9ACTN|nr:cupin [Streptacidiphilus pinicola]RAG82873.1 cupin [Streptacidiphilus pinicola]
MDELTLVARGQLEQARQSPNGRAARLLLHLNMLRQSLIALTQGSILGEHDAPHAASVLVLSGSVQISTESGQMVSLAAGELAEVPQERHDLMALSDAVVLLTTVTGV